MRPTKRKVLIIVENLPVPFDGRVWKEALALTEHGYEVSVLSPRGKGYRRTHEVLQGVHIYRHPMPREGNQPAGYVWEYACALFWEFLFAWWIFLTRGFHVIQGCNPPDDIFLIALPFRLFGVKYIFDHHDLSPELYFSKYRRKDIFYKIQVMLEGLTFYFSHAVISTNCSYKEIAVRRGGLVEDQVFVVRNGPDISTFNPVESDLALKYGKPYLVGYVGTMSIQEGLDILVAVAEHIHNMGRRDIHFTCIGGGPELETLRKMVADKRLGSMFNLTGRIPDDELLRILSTADICVNPDRPCEMNDKSTMIKIMEYMALGKPIVQFDMKEGRYSAQEASLYCDHSNQVNDFAAKIIWLLEHPAERQRMGGFGRARVEKELAWKFSIAPLLAAYAYALSKRGGNRSLQTDVARLSR